VCVCVDGVDVDVVDIPFELVGKVASTGALAEASDVQRLTTARHGCLNKRSSRIVSKLGADPVRERSTCVNLRTGDDKCVAKRELEVSKLKVQGQLRMRQCWLAPDGRLKEYVPRLMLT
jgi:hypothetical protein